MGRIYGPTGALTVSGHGQLLTIADYNPPVVVDDVFDFLAARTGKIEDGTQSIVITQQPVGAPDIRLVPSNGHIVVEGNNNLLSGDFPFEYTKGGTPRTATLRVLPFTNQEGWDCGLTYDLERDSTGEIIFEPAPGMRPIHCTTEARATANGFSFEQIKTIESLNSTWNVNQVADWCLKNTASGQTHPVTGAPVHYGEIEALAVQQRQGERMARLISQNPTLNGYSDYNGVFCLLYEKGQQYLSVDFDSLAGGTSNIGGEGYSYLHANWIGSWGTGARPYIQGTAPIPNDSDRLIIQGLDFGNRAGITNGAAVILSCMRGDSQHLEVNNEFALKVDSDVDEQGIDVTLALVHSKDVSRQAHTLTPGGLWFQNGDRISGLYMGDSNNGLIYRCFVDHGGWGEGYRADRSRNFPQSPSIFNQNSYIQVSTRAITVVDYMTTRGSLAGLQVRAAATILGLCSILNNAGQTLGRGWYDSEVTGQRENGPYRGHYWYVDGTLHTRAGAKDTWDLEMAETGKAHTQNGSNGVMTDHNIVINSEWAYPVFTNDQEFGPQSTRTFLKGHVPADNETYGARVHDGLIISNWNRDVHGEQNVGSVPQATRDALSVDDVAVNELGAGNDVFDLIESFRGKLDTGSDVETVRQHFLDPFGYLASTRTTPTTCLYRPGNGVTHDTPTMRGDVRQNWSTFDMPGKVAGDSINVEGLEAVMNFQIENAISDFTFGQGAKVTQCGRATKPLGTVNVHPDGNELLIIKGGKFDLPGHASLTNVLNVDVNEGRFRNTGTVAGGVDITAHYRAEVLFGYDNASFTLASGRTATLYGLSDIGADGALGGTTTFTAATGSSTVLKPCIKSPVTNRLIAPQQHNIGMSGPDPVGKRPDMFPKVGTDITGLTSGATAKTVFATRALHMIFEDMSGGFTVGEDFSGQGESLGTFDEGPQSPLGRLSDIEIGLPCFKIFRSGITGFDLPNVTFNMVVEAGALFTLDIAGIADGTYTLADVSNISGIWAQADTTILNQGTKDVTLTYSATQLTVTIAEGTGTLNVVNNQ